MSPTADIIAAARQGSRTALARLLSRVESSPERAAEVLHQFASQPGGAYRIGFTGPPGAGKSSLAAAYVRHLRRQAQRVAVLAVDPTSPFSGGALLGDRVRMNSVALDEGVFVRSLATRGDLGGLTRAAGDMADVLDAAGFNTILFETVGVGQSELEIAQYADTTVVVLVPESGDSIQGMKAGLMEIADVFVINKADREGADRFAADLRAAMHLKDWGGWTPPLVLTAALQNRGLEEFDTEVNRHRDHLQQSGEFQRRRVARIRKRIQHLVELRLIENFWSESRKAELEAAIGNNQSPHEIVSRLLKS